MVATRPASRHKPLSDETPRVRGFFEADDGVRTRDPQLGKLMLYQLSYVRARIILAGDTAGLLAALNASRTRRAARPETEVPMQEQALGRRRESSQTMAEYAVILGVITPGGRPRARNALRRGAGQGSRRSSDSSRSRSERLRGAPASKAPLACVDLTVTRSRGPAVLRRVRKRDNRGRTNESGPGGENMAAHDLATTAHELVAEGKGILAADESTGTIKKRFDSIGVESTEESRRGYRAFLFTTEGAADHISGVILYDETIRQSSADGTPFPQVLEDQGIIPGIKVDTGAKKLAGSADEMVTEGLDGLRERLDEYRELGARFTKWRAVISIGDGIPTPYCLQVNAHALGRFAALSQEAGLVPIVEPEVLMDGTHTIERAHDVTADTLHRVFDELFHQRVSLEGMLLKPNMVLAGYDASEGADVDEVAERTTRCLRENVPAAAPGIVFLSGGQSDELATAHLNAMNRMGPHPWELSFSYGRALQAPALKAWGGSEENVAAAQEAYLHRARMNGLARSGEYSEDREAAVAA